jgi:TonB family protein
MKLRFALLGLELALLVGVSTMRPPEMAAQDTSTESVKRKVRSKTVPKYPPLAREMHLAGRVRIEATVSADGRVIKTNVVGGNPLLARAAVEALNLWRFEPAAKDTVEIVEFKFSTED